MTYLTSYFKKLINWSLDFVSLIGGVTLGDWLACVVLQVLPSFCVCRSAEGQTCPFQTMACNRWSLGCTWIATVTDTVLWFLLAKHFGKIVSGIILLLKLKWHTFFPCMFQHSLCFRSDDSSPHYCFCISIALIWSFGGITVYMELANAISSDIQLPSSLPSFLLSPPAPRLSLLSLPHLPQPQVVSFFLSLLHCSFSGSELEGFAHSAAKMWLVFFSHELAQRKVLLTFHATAWTPGIYKNPCRQRMSGDVLDQHVCWIFPILHQQLLLLVFSSRSQHTEGDIVAFLPALTFSHQGVPSVTKNGPLPECVPTQGQQLLLCTVIKTHCST